LHNCIIKAPGSISLPLSANKKRIFVEKTKAENLKQEEKRSSIQQKKNLLSKGGAKSGCKCAQLHAKNCNCHQYEPEIQNAGLRIRGGTQSQSIKQKQERKVNFNNGCK